eukprot:14090721-Alexandrium_andersonii.AAC.1
MSASLVGSEMCIRDRSVVRPLRRGCFRGRRGATASSCACPGGRPQACLLYTSDAPTICSV